MLVQYEWLMSKNGAIHKWRPSWDIHVRGIQKWRPSLELEILWLVKGPELEKKYPSSWKEVVLWDEKTLRLFFSSREFFFSSIWTAKTSLRSVLTTVRSRKRKILSRKRNFAFEFFHLWATSFQPQGTYTPAEKLSTENKPVRVWMSTWKVLSILRATIGSSGAPILTFCVFFCVCYSAEHGSSKSA